MECDCGLYWMARWIQSQHTETGEARCAFPERLRDEKLMNRETPRRMNDFCPKQSEINDECDACSNFPCKNNGKCINTDNFDFQCVCPSGYKGNGFNIFDSFKILHQQLIFGIQCNFPRKI